MENTAELKLNGNSYKLKVIEGSEKEHGIDISNLRSETGCITLDDGYGNTGSCRSAVTFIDGEKGILRYRGIPIEELAEMSTFIEVAHLLIWGHLPSSNELRKFSDLLTENELLHESMKHQFEGFPPTAHPMAILSSMINAAGCFDLDLFSPENPDAFQVQVARLISQVRTIAAFAHRQSRGLPIIYPKPDYKYTANFLHMMFSLPFKDYEMRPEVVKALDLIFVLHADHEQNCSTSTVRMVASSKANLFASTAAGVC
ncbi:MAG TPA: citrate/2-methylcitrate synthase, partial [Verrucomicrobiae bacterium]|nr:citrate/2-methylcitrate synthase [Verrucomicrobiae bacterium]